MKHAPREAANDPPLWAVENGRFRMPVRDRDGVPWEPSWPVVGVSCLDALAFCSWVNQEIGQGHRLPTEDEWGARSARTDGRPFPWGERWSAHHCHTRKATADVPTRRPPRSFAADFSPYGVEQLAGGVTEWTMSTLGAEFHRVVKGGNWSSGAIECRASSRFTMPAEETRLTLGFRLVRDLGDSA